MSTMQNGDAYAQSPSLHKHSQHSRRRSYDKDSYGYDSYSDSFESDSDYGTRKTSPKKKATGNNKATPKKAMKNKGKGNKNTRGAATVSPRDMDVATKRMLSARRLKINELRNQAEELNQLIADLKIENKTLKQEFRRQGRALDRYEQQESELPSILTRHNEETRALRDQARRYKEKYEMSQKRCKDTDEELSRTKKELKKMKELSEDKKLGERDELARKLLQAEIDLDEKDKKLRDLERYVANLQKNQRHELAIETHRHKDTKRKVEYLENEIQRLETQIKEKEKILDIKNIYSNRIFRPPHKLPSGSSTPLSSTRRRGKHGGSLSDISMTPREKARLLEERRREESKKQREKLSPKPSPSPTPSDDSEDSEHERRKQELIRRNQEYAKRTSVHRDDSGSNPDDFRDSNDSWQYKKDKEKWEAEETERRKALEEEQQKEKEKKDAERRDREEREQREREEWQELERRRQEREEEERQRREREEQERREYEEKKRREREEMESREREERMRREREEEERREREAFEQRQQEARKLEEEEKRAQEEREIMERDAQYQEERRKKDLLLARLQAIDAENDENAFVQNKQVERIKEKTKTSEPSTPSSKKSYSFSKPTENLHHGKPSHDDVTVPYIERQRKQSREDADSSYQPSFSSSRRPSERDKKKSDLMKTLFSDSKLSKDDIKRRDSDKPVINDLDDEGDDDLFSKHSKPRRTSGADNLSFNLTSTNSSTKDERNGEAKLLSRRASQPPSTIGKPAISAVDDPDDIEEVML